MNEERPGVLPNPQGTAGRVLLVAAFAFAALLLLVASAHADYEQAAEHFGVSGEAEQLNRSRAIAINAGGAGGVQAGSIYVVGENGRVLRYSPGREGEEPRFIEAWGWGIGKNGPDENEGEPLPEFQRCGPAYAAEPRPAGTFATCRPPRETGQGSDGGGEQPGHFGPLGGVAVDQTTGNVYVLNTPQGPGTREHHLIEVFTATGEAVGQGFGDFSPNSSIDESPSGLHAQSFPTYNGIAVGDAGTVYVIDADFHSVPTAEAQGRVMSFEPQTPGDYEHYVYAGQGKDITTSSSTTFGRIAVVGSNRLVTAGDQQIREYPTTGGPSWVCQLEVQGGQVAGMTANSLTGEVFFFLLARHPAIHRLGPCDESTKEFKELQGAVVPTPETETLFGMAVNPSLAWSAQRPTGVLYGVDAVEPRGTYTCGVDAQCGIGDIFVPGEVRSPVVTSESVVGTTPTATTLRAQIDPRGAATTYRFQYLRASDYLAGGESFEGAQLSPSSPAALGGAGIATAAISGLSPETEYRFRVVATSSCLGPGEPPCVAAGPPVAFTTYPTTSAGLPDGRAYELVSPTGKSGGQVFPADPSISTCGECKPPGIARYTVFPMQSAPDGDAVSYMGYPFSADQGAAVFNSYISRRTADGWETTAMSPPLLSIKGQAAYSQTLTEGVIEQPGSPQLAEGAPSGYANLYVQRTDSPGALQPLLTKALFETHPPHRGPGSLTLKYSGHSADFSAQYFAANDAFTGPGAYAPEAPDPGAGGSNLYEWKGGGLSLVNVLPGNTAVAPGASFVSASPDTNAIAEDGHRVFWTAGGRLYMREDNRTTREIHDAGAFLAASADGLEVLLSDGCLYSLTTTTCTDLTQGQGGFQGIVGQNEDLSRIYFVDTAALAGENERREEAAPGQPNLYFYEAGVGTHFVGTLVSSDGAGGSENLDDWAAEPGLRTAEASPDGRYLAFASSAELTGYDNVGPCSGLEGVEVPCKEVFLYDSATDRLSCPSCNPTGEPPLGNSTLRRIAGAEEHEWLPQPRYLTDRGRLFFDSSDRLSPLDTNGRVEDLYEAEPPGVGSCARAAGCVSLISPGTGSVDSNFLAMGGEGADEGSDVFFTTREPLVPADTDGLIDVYDARVGGGFQGEWEAASNPCIGEACQGSIAGPPASTAPGTQAYQGAGNPKPGKAQGCAKGKVKKGGKCVKKHKEKAKKHKKKAKKSAPQASNHKRGGTK
jgi:hypothetical protein